MRRESRRNFHTCQAVWGEFDFFCRKFCTKPPKFAQQLSKTKSYKVFNDWGKELQNSAEKEHLQTTIPPNFQDLKTTRTRHSARASQILQAKDVLQTPAFTRLILTSNFPYIPYINSKRCWNCTNERKSQKFACDSTKELTKEGLICSVREEPISVQPCQFRFLTNHYQARAANPRKQPEKLGWESGVFSGALRNAFRDPKNSPGKSPEKSSGPRSFRVFWETHARSSRCCAFYTSLLRSATVLKKMFVIAGSLL